LGTLRNSRVCPLLVQSDAHFWNCGSDVRLFDWDCSRVDVATDDLAYLIAMH
jgi:hypothetical protein